MVSTREESISPVYIDLGDGRPHRSLHLEIRGGGPVRIFGAVIERDGPAVVVDELGIGGSGARRQLHWDEDLWHQHVKRRAPALAILAYGGIESMRRSHDPDRFRAELETIIDRLEAAAPASECLLMTPQDRAHRAGGRSRRRPASLDSILGVITAVADDRGCALFDTHAVMGGAGSMPRWVEAGLARRDHVHFTKRGYAHLGRALVDAILAAPPPRSNGP